MRPGSYFTVVIPSAARDLQLSRDTASEHCSATLARMTMNSRLETGQTDQRPGFHQCKAIVPRMTAANLLSEPSVESREPDVRTQSLEPRAQMPRAYSLSSA